MLWTKEGFLQNNMSNFFNKLSKRQQTFINEQKIFFVATAPKEGRINLSPKGMDSLIVFNERRVLWLNVTGSGNETAAHVLENKRITLMFCAFEGAPNIVRIYGTAKAIHPSDIEWKELISLFPTIPGARQIFDVAIESVQTSCGMSVPYFDYKGEREDLNDWASSKGKDGIANYWKEKNQKSIDGIDTGIFS